jgi:hypothetical protein
MMVNAPFAMVSKKKKKHKNSRINDILTEITIAIPIERNGECAFRNWDIFLYLQLGSIGD